MTEFSSERVVYQFSTFEMETFESELAEINVFDGSHHRSYSTYVEFIASVLSLESEHFRTLYVCRGGGLETTLLPACLSFSEHYHVTAHYVGVRVRSIVMGERGEMIPSIFLDVMGLPLDFSDGPSPRVHSHYVANEQEKREKLRAASQKDAYDLHTKMLSLFRFFDVVPRGLLVGNNR